MKTRIVTLAGLLVAVIAAVTTTVLLSPSLPPRAWTAGVPQWKGSGDIAVVTYASQYGPRKGDAFSYFVQVWYNRSAVESVDTSSVDKGVNLSPFEVRGVTEREYDADAEMRVYEREYRLQLIKGEVGRTYEFPTIVVHYRPRGGTGLLSAGADAQPIFVAARLPAEIDGLELRPIAPTVKDRAQTTLPWVLWGIGAVTMALGMVDLLWRVAPRWRSRRGKASATWRGTPVAEAYRALHGNLAAGAEPQALLHQMDHIVRVALASRDGLDWLEEPDLQSVPAAIRPQVTSLLDQCEQAYQPTRVDKDEIEEALEKLDAALVHYYGKQEVEAWRN